MSRLPVWTAAVAEFDAAIAPIANRPVALADLPSLAGRPGNRDPLAEAGVRDAVAVLIADILDAYPRLNCAERIQIRAIVDRHRAFGWAVGFLLPVSTAVDASTLRRQLLLFSLLDQGTDSRDALLALRALCGQPGIDGAALPELLREAASLSSPIDRYHMGSTASMLAAAAADRRRH